MRDFQNSNAQIKKSIIDPDELFVSYCFIVYAEFCKRLEWMAMARNKRDDLNKVAINNAQGVNNSGAGKCLKRIEQILSLKLKSGNT